MERMASTGSIKRPGSINSQSGYIPSSPVNSLPTTSSSLAPPSTTTHHHEDAFSNNPEDYDIRLPIGYGSSAVVYNAYYKPLNRRVAIKVIDLDMFERNQIDELRRETQVMALCKHPNVLRVNGAFVADSKLYIVTPYLSAGSCLDIMKTAYPDGFDEISIATILKQALQGLDYLHKNGHIHRDVKAGNLLMDDDGSVLLGDFGVSSSLMENGDRRGMRKTFVGTPCWMAPEVMEQAGYDYKADIWSFGITAIELATGHAPFAKYPPIKVLMLTLSNDPPTLDRESTKHRYSKLLKEMIDCCLQKDPSRRPSAEKLLNHSFFKQAKKKSHLVTGLLHNLPPLEQRPPKKAAQKPTLPQKGISWDFDGDDLDETAEGETPVRRPRTVTFEPVRRPISVATTDSIPSAGTLGTPLLEPKSADTLSEDGFSPSVSVTSDKPIKKSRFVIEESSGSSAMASPILSHTVVHGTETGHSPISAVSPPPSMDAGSIQLGQHLQGLGVSSNGSEASSAPEVRKGRFSVKDTTLSISSPSPANLKAMTNDSLLSPSRSLSSSPIEGTPDGVRIGGPLDVPPSERKSRFEVHHNHGSPVVAGVPTSTNGTTLNSPVLSATHGSALSRESSQSRAMSDAVLSRESSATRVSRFSVEPSSSPLDHASAPSSGVASSSGTPNPSAGSASLAQSKRSRFQVSTVEGRVDSPLPASEIAGSTNSTPNTSPSASLLRGQGPLVEPHGQAFVHSHLDSIYRHNEYQRMALQELFDHLKLKVGGSADGMASAPMALPVLQLGSHPSTIPTSVLGLVSSGSVHRQEHGQGQGQGSTALERQLQMTIKENESLRRENEALKRELDRLRRGH